MSARVRRGGGRMLRLPAKSALPVPTEEAEQRALVAWADLQRGKAPWWPEDAYLVHVNNGNYAGPKGVLVGQKHRAMGQRKGYPDLQLTAQRGGFGMLFIEMKRKKGGRLSPEQKNWLDLLNRQGYKAVVCKGFDEARAVIIDYLKGGQN